MPPVESSPAHRLKVLFVCARNRWRSPTAERLYARDPRLQVRSAGLRKDARRRLSSSDLAWADVVFVMERGQKKLLREQFVDLDLPEVRVLEVPDEFEYMEPELQVRLREAIDPEIDSLLTDSD